MRTFFGAPLDLLLAGVGIACLLVLMLLAAVAVRNPLLLRLAVRNAPRRPGFAALITFGLALGTVILSTSFTTGDTMSQSVRQVVAGVVGSADEVVFLVGQAPRPGTDVLEAIASGNLLTLLAAPFPEASAEPIRQALADDPRVAGILPALLDAEPAEVPGGLRATVTLYGVAEPLPPGFSALRDRTGGPLALSDLADGEVYANDEAASQLGLGAGDVLTLVGLGEPRKFTVRQVARAGDLGGAQAIVYLPLTRLQALLGRPGMISQVLIANRGGEAERLRQSWPVTVRLRAGFMDEAVAARLFRTFTSGLTRPALEQALERTGGRQAEKLRRLLATLDLPGPTDEFKALVQDPDLLSRLTAAFPGGQRSAERSGGPFGRAGDGTFRVVDVQQVAQDQADRWGAAFTDLFVVLGLFSLASGGLLIVLLFSLLALERRSELGVTRALGARRRDVVAALALEGALYAAVASLAGAALGVVVALGLVTLAGSLVGDFGFRLVPRVEPASLAVSVGLGFALTFATLVVTSWRSSRFSIVSAIRDLPEPPARPPSLLATILAALPLLAGGVLTLFGSRQGLSLAYAAGVVLTIVGLALSIRALALRAHLPLAERVVFTNGGLLLILWWQVPTTWLARAGLPSLPPAVEMAFLGGIAGLLGAVWVVAYNVGLLGGRASRFVVWRLATAYVASHRFRTGVTLAMFSVVVVSLTLGAVLLASTDLAYADARVLAGGWDIRAEADNGAAAPLSDLVRRAGVLPEVEATGSSSAVRVEAVQPAAPDARWRATNLVAVDAEFARGAQVQVEAAPTGESPDRTWATVADRPGAALVGAALVRAAGASAARFPVPAGDGFTPFVLWVRDTREPRAAVRLEVVGVIDARGPYGSAIVASGETLRQAGWSVPLRSTGFVRTRPNADPRSVAAALAAADPSRTVQSIADDLRLVRGIRGLLTLVLQGFMGIGLLAGIAAVATLSARAVVERRRHLGVLRSIGFSAGMVASGLLVEAALLASLGCALGVALGLLVASGTLQVLQFTSPELRMVVPWAQVLLMSAATVVTSLLLTLLPALSASRRAPAAAMRDA
ncbi:MAG: FtsX-like permease family protein [Chloroflexi bacterium]|nr:FtsX-like permease family protein [Chloroflexota bacterium]